MEPGQSKEDPSIGEMANLSISSPTVPVDNHPITLTDLPEDILQVIAGLLLNGDFSSDGYLRHCEVKRWEAYERDRRRKDILAFTSCCKGMRTVIFGRWFLSKLVVQLTEMELEQVEALSLELRECVRYLLILPGGTSPQDTGRLFSFIDFIRLFPNVGTLRIRWAFFEEDDPFLLGLNANVTTLLDAERNQTEDNQVSSSKITKVLVETLDPFEEDYRDLDDEHIRQLHLLLQQLQFPQMRSLHLDFGHYHGLHFAGSEALWTALIEAFATCQSSVMEEVQLDCRMLMNGHAIGFDLCDTLKRVFGTCWTSPAMKKVDIHLAYVGEGGDSYRFWTTTDRPIDRNTTLSLALLPPFARLIGLVNAWRLTRPSLNDVYLEVECQIPWDPMDKVYLPAHWSFGYPSTVLEDYTGTWFSIEDDENNPTKIQRIPMDVGCAMLAVKDKQVHSACTFILREKVAHEQLMGMFTAAAGNPVAQRFLRQWG